jgi:hypothetical protein
MSGATAGVTISPSGTRTIPAWRLGERLAAACGALYVVLLVGGDDFINGAGEPPEHDASLREVTTYLANADTTSFWVGRSIGLLGLCALVVFAVYLSRRIRAAETSPGILSGLVLAAGTLTVALQFIAAPAQFAAVERAGEGLDPQVARALLDLGTSFVLSFFPLAIFLGSVGTAALRYGVLPKWLAISAFAVAAGLLGGILGRPADPAVVAYMAFALCLLWFVAASVALLRRVRRQPVEGGIATS